MRKQLGEFAEFLQSAGGVLFEWAGDGIQKILRLQFLELTVDQAAFFVGCILIMAMAIIKLARRRTVQ